MASVVVFNIYIYAILASVKALSHKKWHELASGWRNVSSLESAAQKQSCAAILDYNEE